MIKHPRAAIAAIALFAASVAFAGGTPKPTPASSSSSSQASSQAVGVGLGVGVGIAHGGKSHAQATGGSASATGGKGGAGGHASAIGEGGAGGNAAATQTQTAEGGSASQSQSSTASNEGNHQSLSVSSSYRDRLQAPGVFAPAVYASGPCAYGWSAGVSFPGGGLSGGKAKTDPGCDRREIARVLTPLNPELALKVLCADPIVAEVAAPGDCEYIRFEQEATTPVPTDMSAYATKEELDRVFRQAVAK